MRIVPNYNGTVSVAFTDDPWRVAALEEWNAHRAKCVECERPALERRRIFERIHAVWTTIQREESRGTGARRRGVVLS